MGLKWRSNCLNMGLVLAIIRPNSILCVIRQQSLSGGGFLWLRLGGPFVPVGAGVVDGVGGDACVALAGGGKACTGLGRGRRKGPLPTSAPPPPLRVRLPFPSKSLPLRGPTPPQGRPWRPT